MTEVLSGGTNGSSLLTGLTIPLVFKQTFDDMGFYSGFDGFILQKDVVSNFVFTGSSDNQYTINVYNTSDELKKFLKLSNYVIDWGDGTVEDFNAIYPDYMSHVYANFNATYTIKITQKNPWGSYECREES